MDRVFSVGEISEQFWSTIPSSSDNSPKNDHSSKMNRSESEWAFQRFLQEAHHVAASGSSPQQSSSSAAGDSKSDSLVEIKSTLDNSNVKDDSNTDKTATSTAAGNPVSFSVSPNIPVDSAEYQAFLKSKLNLACAAVALSRVSCLYLFVLFVDFVWMLRKLRKSIRLDLQVGWLSGFFGFWICVLLVRNREETDVKD